MLRMIRELFARSSRVERRGRKLRFESLESRNLLAADVGYDPLLEPVEQPGFVETDDAGPQTSALQAAHQGVYEVPGTPSDAVGMTFSWDFREAGYNNDIYYFLVDDTQGTLDGISTTLPEQEAGESDADYQLRVDQHRSEYKTLAQARGVLLFDGATIPNYTSTPVPTHRVLPGGSLISFYLVQNGDNYVWFPFDELNQDGEAHFQLTEPGDIGYRSDVDLQYKVEDLSSTLPNPRGYKNDGDFNDVVFSVAFTGFAPVFSQDNYNFDVDENSANGTLVGTVVATDADPGDTVTYSVKSGDPDSVFSLDAITGEIVVNKSNMLDFENFDSQYNLVVEATDGTFTTAATVTIDVNNVNEAPTDILLSSASVDENQPAGTPVGNFTAADPDSSDTHTYTLVAGTGDTDNGSFEIVGTELRTKGMFDFEGQNSYDIRVRVTDSGNLTREETFTIAVNNVNEAPTDIALSKSDIDENEPAGSVVGAFSTTDPDSGDTHTYSLVSGTGDTDNASFEIDGNNLKIKPMPDFEGQSSYTIRVQVTDSGSLTYEESFTITVNNLNEAPTDITLSNDDIAENSPPNTVIGTLSADDPDSGDTHSFALVPGSMDNRFFNIVGNRLRSSASFDRERQDTYFVNVEVTDSGGLTYNKLLTITVTNVNEKPTIDVDNQMGGNQDFASIRIGPDRSPDEDSNYITTVRATDPDSGEMLTFEIVRSNRPGMFEIDATSGRITLAQAVTSSTPPIVEFFVRVTDSGGLTDTGRIVIRPMDTSVGVTGDTQADEGTTDNISLKFIRQSSDLSDPLDVHFRVHFVASGTTRATGNLSQADLVPGDGLNTLLAGVITIPEGETTATLDLDAVDDGAVPGMLEGIEEAYIVIEETHEYAVVKSSSNPADPAFKKQALDVSSWTPIQVIDGVTLFATGPGDGTDIHYNDVVQGSVGDCFLHAVLAHLAQHHPNVIRNAVREDPSPEPYDYIVTWYDYFGYEQTTNVDLNLTRGQDQVQLSGDYDANGDAEVWSLVIEQAFAQEQGGYDNIDNGGLSDTVWEWMTGESATYDNLQGPLFQDSDEQIAEKIADALDDGKGVMIGSVSNPPDLVGSHAYSVMDVVRDGAGEITGIQLYNPHGTQPNGEVISLDDLNENFNRLYIGDAP